MDGLAKNSKTKSPDWDRVKILAENGLRAGTQECLPLLAQSLVELGDLMGAREHFEAGVRKEQARLARLLIRPAAELPKRRLPCPSGAGGARTSRTS